MEKVESRALWSFRGTAPSHLFRYVDNSNVRIKTQEIELNTDHINAVDRNIKKHENSLSKSQYETSMLKNLLIMAELIKKKVKVKQANVSFH